MRSLFWPLVALGALLLFNLLFTEGFARLTIRNGHVYGSLVDILKLSSRVMLVSLGMTIVIATAGGAGFAPSRASLRSNKPARLAGEPAA